MDEPEINAEEAVPILEGALRLVVGWYIRSVEKYDYQNYQDGVYDDLVDRLFDVAVSDAETLITSPLLGSERDIARITEPEMRAETSKYFDSQP